TPEAVLETLSVVAAAANEVLGEFQEAAGAPPSTWYRTAPAVPAAEVEDVTPSRWRTAGAVLAVGSAFAAALATGVDALINRRRRSSASEPTDVHAPEAEVHPALAQPEPAEDDDWELVTELESEPPRTAPRRPPSSVRQVKRRPKPMQGTSRPEEPALTR